MVKQVDSYCYLSGITKRMIKSWIKMEHPRPIPWTPLTKQVEIHPPEDPPIGRYLQRHPWFLPKLLTRDVPA